MRPLKYERTTYVALSRAVITELGIAYGGDPEGNGVPIVVCGRESRPQGQGGQVALMQTDGEVCVMQDAATVLSIIRERSEQGQPLEHAYRLLYNPSFYLYAYGRISSNDGAMTPGVTGETVDGMSLEKIQRIIAVIRQEAYVWTPVRRIHIPKKQGGKRPLGIPDWSDKLLEEVMRLILEAHFEPRFSARSHGFRPNHGCHTALQEVKTWTGTKWFIEARRVGACGIPV